MPFQIQIIDGPVNGTPVFISGAMGHPAQYDSGALAYQEVQTRRAIQNTTRPDSTVRFHIVQIESESDSDTEKLPGSGGRGGWGTAVYGGASESYTQGILVIDIFDAAEGQSVWRGASAKKITADDRENMAEVINAVVDTILSDYPPR